MEHAVVILLLAAFMLPAVLVLGVAIVGPRLSPRVRERFLTFAVSPWRPVLAGGVALVLFTTVNVLASSGSVLRAMIGSLPMAMMFAGFGMLGQMSRRTGTIKRCAKCEYDLSGVVEEGMDDARARCPECGAQWNTAGGTVVGDKRWSRLGITLACVLLLPLVASLTLPFVVGFQSMNGPLMKLLPTDSLIKQLTTFRGFRMDEWVELRKRTLTTDQREALAQGLLTRDAVQLHAWGDEARWVGAEFAAGRLSAETQAAVLRRFLQLELLSPSDPSKLHRQESRPADAPQEPSSPTWTVAGDGAWGLGGCFTGWTVVAVTGPIVDDADTVIREPAVVEVLVDLSVRSQPPSKSTWTGDDPLEPSLKFGSSGSPRLSVWLIAEPRVRGPQSVIWKDGSPVTAPDAIVVRFDLSPSMK